MRCDVLLMEMLLMLLLSAGQNERYQISSFGWSKNGLLPTDRKHLSTRNGKTGWATLEVRCGWVQWRQWRVDVE